MELGRQFRSRWFWISAVLTICALWAGLGTESWWLLHGAEMEAFGLLENTLTGSSNSLALPLLSALPCAAAARREINSGAVRHILFRCGLRAYLCSRTAVLLLVSVSAQAAGTAAFILLINVLAVTPAFPVHLFCARMLCTAVFALLGSLGALVTKDTTCAYAVPAAICFALSMLRSRFMAEAAFLDPLCWLTGNAALLPGLCGLLFVLTVVYISFLCREVKRNV